MSIADNIKALREKYGLTQSELGEIAGVSDKAVSTWENGTAEPRMGAVQRIAEHFHISKGSIVDDSPTDLLPELLTAPEQALLNDFRQLNDEGQELVLKTVSGLVASGLYIKTDSPRLVEGA